MPDRTRQQQRELEEAQDAHNLAQARLARAEEASTKAFDEAGNAWLALQVAKARHDEVRYATS